MTNDENFFHTTTGDEATFYTDADMPNGDPEGVRKAYEAIVARHFLATLRQASDQSLSDIAKRRGVTTPAIHQTEKRALVDMRVGTLLDQIRAIGFPVDEDWLAQSLAAALSPLDRAA